MHKIAFVMALFVVPNLAIGCNPAEEYGDPYAQSGNYDPSTPYVQPGAMPLKESSGFIPTPNAPVERFDIAANTVECYGPFLQRCLVVNGEYFYSQIKGYNHIEGQAAVIYVR